MEGSAGPLPPPQEPEEVVALLQQQMARLKRWFAWELWLIEPRTFAPPDDQTEAEPPSRN